MPRTDVSVIAYSIDALVAEGFTVRAIRNYINRGVLPKAHGRGATAYYTDAHISALRQIKKMRDERVYLEDIAERMRMAYPGLYRN